MNIYLQQWLIELGLRDTIATFASISIIIVTIVIAAWVTNHIAKRYILAGIRFLLKRNGSTWGNKFLENNVFLRLSHLVPALVIYVAIPLIIIPDVEFTLLLADITKTLVVLYAIIVMTSIIFALLNSVEHLYNTLEISKRRPIKSYMQVAKLIFFIVAAILAISVIINKSPLVFLTGLGAMTAVTMLVFQDSIKGFVASIQLTVYDMVRIGDWIEMPEYGADGDVVDVALNTIKVQNFDKTVVTIPSYALLTNGVKNWRGMTESGGRRIKRSINIDMQSIKFCDDTLLNKLSKVQYLTDYIAAKRSEIDRYNKEHGIDKTILVNGRHLTNIGLFRAYLDGYLKHHPHIHQGLTFLIRQLQPTENGIPLELYIFTNDTNWVRYEAIQADIFDHLLAALPEFELRIFQNFTGKDVTVAMESIAKGV